MLQLASTVVIAQWQDISPQGFETVTLFDVKFINDNTGFAVGQNTSSGDGYIFKTTDGGTTWTSETFADAHLRSIDFSDNNTAFVVGYDGPPGTHTIFIFTQDQGQNWTKATDANYTGMNGIQFLNNTTAYTHGYGSTFGSNSGIMKTTNGGANWSYVADNSGLLIEGMHFINSNTGFFAVVTFSGSGTVQKTENGGSSFTTIYPGTSWVYDVFFIDNNTGFALEGLSSTNRNIIKTTDGGQNWTSSNHMAALTKIIFIDNNTGYALGKNGSILKTTDCGASWQTETSGTTSTIRGNSVSDKYIYACGNSGKILKSLHGVSMRKEELLSSVNKINLYPNPTNDFINLKFENPVNSTNTIKIYDCLGKLILEFELDNTNKADIQHLNKGFYIYEVIQDGIVRKTGKIIKN